MEYPLILSFDVGIIHLSYCLMTKKKIDDNINYHILEWNNIDLTNNIEYKCNECNQKAIYTNILNNINFYYCKNHKKIYNLDFNNYFNNDNSINNCCHMIKNKNCDKKSKYICNNNNYCSIHAKQKFNNMVKLSKTIKIISKNIKNMNFDTTKINLIKELENKKELLKADYVLIENQPSFKNPRMKSIATTLYDYYVIRGIIDKDITKSNILEVKFISPSNKLKFIDQKDNNDLKNIKNKSEEYKLTKNLSIKYCDILTKHLIDWNNFYNNNKKKDDLADAFLQGKYYLDNN